MFVREDRADLARARALRDLHDHLARAAARERLEQREQEPDERDCEREQEQRRDARACEAATATRVSAPAHRALARAPPRPATGAAASFAAASPAPGHSRAACDAPTRGCATRAPVTAVHHALLTRRRQRRGSGVPRRALLRDRIELRIRVGRNELDRLDCGRLDRLCRGLRLYRSLRLGRRQRSRRRCRRRLLLLELRGRLEDVRRRLIQRVESDWIAGVRLGREPGLDRRRLGQRARRLHRHIIGRLGRCARRLRRHTGGLRRDTTLAGTATFALKPIALALLRGAFVSGL